MLTASAEAVSLIASGPTLYTYVSSVTESPAGQLVASDLFGPTSGYLLGGTVTIDRAQLARRTCRLTVANPAGAWTPREAGDIFAPFSLIKVQRGILLRSSGDVERVPMGVYVVSSIAIGKDAAGRSTLDVDLVDLTARAEIAKPRAPLVFRGGTGVGAGLLELGQTIGLIRGPYSIDDGGAQFDATTSIDALAEGLAAYAGLARDHGLEAFFDATGTHIVRPIPDPTTATPLWRFVVGEAGNTLTSIRRSLQSARIRNAVVVIGQSAARGQVSYEARITNPIDPLVWGGRFGDRPHVYSSADIHTEEQAKAVAEPLLIDLSLAQYDYALGASNNPLLESGDVIAAYEADTGTDSNLRIEPITHPLDTANIGLSSSELRALVA